MKIKVTRTHNNKNIDTWRITNKQDNRYQLIPPQDTSDIARRMSLVRKKKRKLYNYMSELLNK